MIPRYEQPEITKIWSDETKLAFWQDTEMFVLDARVRCGELDAGKYREISRILSATSINIEWWLARDKLVRHDLNAFIDERRRHLPVEIQADFHKKITSYDTEESAFVRMLTLSLAAVEQYSQEFLFALKGSAIKYRYTIMMGRTHGQEAELQTHGKRCLTWHKSITVDCDSLAKAKENLSFSKISGALGNYSGINPEIEKEALLSMGLAPFYGATQIMPRELYVPLASALCQIVGTLDKIATDIRLGARSGRPIYQEPFDKQQKGSSRMPHKKNTINTEQMEGMARIARGFLLAIMENIKTWEERAIEQSCVERVGWPDLFHVVVHSLRVMTKVIRGLNILADNMILEIVDSRGCYASGEVAAFLGEKGVALGLSAEEAYRIVQLAAFNAFEPWTEELDARENLPTSLNQATELLLKFRKLSRPRPVSIEEIIPNARLKALPEQLEDTEADVNRWNRILREIFSGGENSANHQEFQRCFDPSYLLRNEPILYKEILGIN